MKNLRLIMFVAFAVCALCLSALGQMQWAYIAVNTAPWSAFARGDGTAEKKIGDDTTDVDDGLGTKWYETEYYGRNKGTWTRLGTTSKFKAKWSGLTADLDIRRDGNTVTVIRTNSSDGNDCTYTGTIQPNGKTVTGTYKCEKYTPPEGLEWSATIR